MYRRTVANGMLTAVAALLIGGDAAAQQPASLSFEQLAALTQQSIDLAVAMRSSELDMAPVTGQLDLSLLRLHLGFMITIRAQGQPVWGYVHLFLNHPASGDSVRPCDAVFLPPSESASHFFEATRVFQTPDVLGFTDCMLEGEVMRTAPGRYRDMPPWKDSATRALIHLSEFLEYFALYKVDPERAADFATVGLARWRDVLQEANEPGHGGLAEVKSTLKLFDQVFPVSALTAPLPLGPEGRSAARALFQTTVQLRRRLGALAPEVGANLARDEALLRQFGGRP